MLTMVLVAKDVVEKDFLSVPRDTNALDAARQMKAKRHGFAIIASPSGGPEGIVTEWDYLSKLVAEGKDPSRVKIGDIMTSDLVSADANIRLDRAAELQARTAIRSVRVLTDNSAVGLI